jgi:transcriptional regulator with XRE-family HTH domain
MSITDNILATNEYFEISSPPYLAHTIASHFKTKRMEINLSQEELARRSGVSLGSLKRFESLHQISLKNLLKLAVVLNSTGEFLSLLQTGIMPAFQIYKRKRKLLSEKEQGVSMLKSVEILEVAMNNIDVGKLIITSEHLCAFEYNTGYLSSGISVSPFYLPLKPGVFIAKRDPFNGLFGVFNDSLPDGWGMLLTDRFLMKNKINPAKLTLLDRLCLVGNAGMGALTYKPDHAPEGDNDYKDLNQLSSEVQRILNNDFTGSLEELYQKGGSSGGARPKVLVSINNEYWIIKFRASADPENIGEIEYQYSQVAGKCGLEMPETSLFEENVLTDITTSAIMFIVPGGCYMPVIVFLHSIMLIFSKHVWH